MSGGLTLEDATVRIGDRDGSAGGLFFDGGTQSLGGSGTIVFGASSSNRIHASGAYAPGRPRATR